MFASANSISTADVAKQFECNNLANVTTSETVTSTWTTPPVSKYKSEAELMKDIYGSAGTANVTPSQTVTSTGATPPVSKAKSEAELMKDIYGPVGKASNSGAGSPAPSGGGGFLSGLFNFFMPFMQLVMNTLSMTNPFAGFVDAIIKATNKKA